MVVVVLLLAACRQPDTADALNRQRRATCMAPATICPGYPYCLGGETKRDCLDKEAKVTCAATQRDAGARCAFWGGTAYPPGCVFTARGERPCECAAAGVWVCEE